MYDLLIVGGGINGAGVARDAAGRGLKVLLCEKDDLASHTSSASTKLIHGGLRYLEHYDFALVRKALIEREVLLRSAPHIIWPMRFVLPLGKGMRPAWMIRLGLFLYDHLGGREILPGTSTVRGRAHEKLSPLKEKYRKAFEYSDCWVEDSRLVTLNAVDAAERGAKIMTRTECVSLKEEGGLWSADLRAEQQAIKTVKARAVVNAAGPWVDKVAGNAGLGKNSERVRLVKGSHIIVRKKYSGEHAYFFQNEDGRIGFAIPYEGGEYTLIGTTDVPFEADPQDFTIDEAEIDYLREGASEYFREPISRSDIVATYSGVRPLYDDMNANASAVTRDYVLSKDDRNGAAIVSVYGGKITTYRKLAEDVMGLLKGELPEMSGKWTADSHLPGGDIANADFDAFEKTVRAQYGWIEEGMLRRLLRAYGTRIFDLLGSATSLEGLGFHYGGGLYQKEVDYLINTEFAQTAEDILCRRSKLYLHMKEDQQAALHKTLQNREAA